MVKLLAPAMQLFPAKWVTNKVTGKSYSRLKNIRVVLPQIFKKAKTYP